MKTSRFAVLSAAVALALAATPALAHGPGRGGACRQDLANLCSQLTPTPAPGPFNCVKALCPTAIPGTGDIVTCLQGLAVSDACKAELSDLQAKITAWKTAFTQACTANDLALCNNVKTGPWGQVQCLRQAVNDNKDVSQSCQLFVAQHHPPMGWHGPGPQGFGATAEPPQPHGRRR